MRILDLEARPFRELRYMNAARRGGSEVTRLPIHRARVDRLPPGLDAIVATSDLQGMAPLRSAFGQSRLLGESLAELLVDLAEKGELPPLARTGIVLAGDLYSDPAARQRGGLGDVTDVWLAFAKHFAWVTGVAGNHDELDVGLLAQLENASFLDGSVVVHDEVRFGGVSGIIGNPARPQRRDEGAFLERVVQVLALDPDMLVLHEGPEGDDDQRGNSTLREWVDEHPALVVCGHVHWERPLAERRRGGQILNVDARAVVLGR